MALVVYARCPECGAEVEDPMVDGTFECTGCSAEIRSRGPELGWTVRPVARTVEEGKGYQETSLLDPVLFFLKRLAHVFVIVAIISLACVIVLDVGVLVWGYFPVGEAALLGLGSGVLFIITPYPIGDSVINGATALGLGLMLVLFGALLFGVNLRGRWPGLGGIGTRFVALLLLALGIAMAVWGALLTATGHLVEGVTVPSYMPTPVGVLSLKFWELSTWHTFLIGAILASFAMMVVKCGPAFVATIRRSLERGEPPPVRTDNCWVLIFRIYLAMYFFYVVYYALLAYFTVDTHVPPLTERPLWRQLYMFAHASVWEEVLSRVLMLGVPLMFYYAVTRRESPPVGRFFFGGGLPIDTAAFVLIFIQAVVFALAHVAGWDLWKALPTCISGLAFGYLFCRHGLWAAIMLHFTFDYLGMTGQVLGHFGVNIDTTMGLLYLLWLGAGFILFTHFVVVMLREGPGVVRAALEGRPGGPP